MFARMYSLSDPCQWLCEKQSTPRFRTFSVGRGLEQLIIAQVYQQLHQTKCSAYALPEEEPL